MNREIDFISGNARKALWKMIMPLFVAMLLMLAYNLIDSIWIGNLLGENGYAALTTAGSVSILLYAVTMGIGNGTSVVVSQLVGAEDRKKKNTVISTVIVMSILFAAVVIVLLESFLEQILLIFQTPGDIYADAKSYLAIFLVGYVVIFVYMQLTSIYRSFGNPAFQMFGMLLGTVFNAIADPLFIKWLGISGAAIATVLSQVICLVFAVIYGKKKAYFQVDLKGIHVRTVIWILNTVIPSCVQNCIPAISSMIMVILVNRFDVTTIAAYGVVKNIENIMFYPAMAMNMALITIIGQLFGAKRYDRMKEYMKAALVDGVLLEAVLTGIVLLLSMQISMVFVKEPAVAVIADRGLRIIGIGYLCYMATGIFTAKFAGLGRVNLFMFMMLLYYIVIRVPLAIVLIRSSFGLDGMWIAILISHLVALFIVMITDRILTY